MRRAIGFCWVGLVVCWAAAASGQQVVSPEFPRTEVLVLGTYHMANPGNDVYNTEADDVLSARRQAEIRAVVEALVSFEPTRVALESDFGTDRVVEGYRAYLAGERELTRNEIDQIGYRVAEAMGHSTVYPVDGDVDGIDPRPAWAKFPEIVAARDRYAESFVAGPKLADSTVGEYLGWLNTPEYAAANHFFYTAFGMRMTEPGDDRSITWIADWYERNLLIVANLLKIAEADGSDRILVIFGAGHSYLLHQFLSESPHFEVVDARQYLPRE